MILTVTLSTGSTEPTTPKYAFGGTKRLKKMIWASSFEN